MYGHLLIILGVNIGMVLMNERPHLKDFLNVMTFTTVAFLPAMYGVNFLLDANYWYILEKPVGDNITALMPDAPYHILALIPVAWLFTFAIYVPFLLKDKNA